MFLREQAGYDHVEAKPNKDTSIFGKRIKLALQLLGGPGPIWRTRSLKSPVWYMTK